MAVLRYNGGMQYKHCTIHKALNIYYLALLRSPLTPALYTRGAKQETESPRTETNVRNLNRKKLFFISEEENFDRNV